LVGEMRRTLGLPKPCGYLTENLSMLSMSQSVEGVGS